MNPDPCQQHQPLRVLPSFVLALVFVLVLALVLALVLSAGVVQADPPAKSDVAAEVTDAVRDNPFADLIRYAEALVTVRFVVRVQMPRIDQQTDSEITCVVIGEQGLVLCSDTQLGGYFGVMARMMGQSDSGIHVQTSALRVVANGESEGLEADLIARDSERDLAWLQVRNPPAEGLAHLDLSYRAEASIGHSFYHLRRLSPYFGSQPVVAEGVVAAIVGRPRTLIVPSRPGEGHLGMPAFTADGKLIGFFVAQVPGEDEAGYLSLRSRALPGQPGEQDDMLAGVLLPAADVARATELARDVWAEDQRDALE